MIKFRAAALTDIGRVRRRNEDRMLLDETHLIFGVADGVGGLPGGAEAAELALQFVATGLSKDGQADVDLSALIGEASDQVNALGHKLSPQTGIGSTLTLGQIHGRTLRLGHVGDSRCYLWRGGELTTLTTDHTVENEILARRARGESVYFHEANRHALTRCMGQPGKIEVDVIEQDLQSRDRYLFCTDGICGLVDNPELADLLARDDEPENVLRDIIALAIRRGGPDNATGVILRIDSLN